MAAMYRDTIGRASAWCVMGLAVATTAPAWAQNTAQSSDPVSAEAADESSLMSDIVVTAQRRSENLSNVGIAAAAFSGDQIQKLGLQNSVDIVQFVPGVTISSDTGGQNLKFIVRGVAQNDFLDAVEAPIAVYVDDTYIAPQQGQVFGLFDLERVEVLKGPQGTLFGRNATGGLVHYISRKPEFERTDGFFDLTYGSYNQVRVEAAIGAPITEKIAFRVSALFSRYDPVLINEYPRGALTADPAPRPQDNLYNQNLQAGRLHLAFRPSNRLNLLLSGSASLSRQGGGGYETRGIVAVFDDQGRWVDSVVASATETRPGIGPGGASVSIGGVPARPVPGGNLFGWKEASAGDFRGSYDFAYDNSNVLKSRGVSLQADWEVSDSVNLTSVTDYKWFSKVVAQDVDVGPADFFIYKADAITRQVSQEIRLSGDSGSLKWVTGAFYLHIDNDTKQGLSFRSTSILATPGQPGLTFATLVGLKTDSISAFGQADWQFAERFTLVAGGRFIRESKDYRFAQNAYVNLDDIRIDTSQLVFPLPQPAGVNPFADSFTQNLWAAKLQLEYRAADGWLLYGGINRGVKAGSVNGPLGDGSQIQIDQLIYEPEVLLSYEAGFKGRLLNGDLRLNGAIFHYDYKDYQAFTFVNASGLVSNENGRTYGAELEAVAQPVRGVTLSLSGSYTDALIRNLEAAPGVFRDVRPVYTPEFQSSGLVRYDVDVGPGRVGFQIDGSYTGARFSNLRNFQAQRLPSYFLTNARISWTEGAWQVTAFVTNVLDKRWQREMFDLATLCGCANDAYGPPRWFGASIRYSL